MDILNTLLTLVQSVVGSLTGWINKVFEIFDEYTESGYSKYIIIGLLMLIAGQFVSLKFNINTGKK